MITARIRFPRLRAGRAFVSLLLTGGALTPVGAWAQERAPRPIPPLRIPPAPRVSPFTAHPSSEIEPLLRFTLSEGTPGAEASPPRGEVVPLAESRVDELLTRLPPRPEAAGPDATVVAISSPPEPGGVALPSSAAELRVLSVTPSGTSELAPWVTVLFSEPMVALGIDGEPTGGSVPARLDPDVPGAWRWLDVRTLRFEPDRGRLPGATEFTVRVPEGVALRPGARMEEEHVARFRTAGPRVLGGHPSRDVQWDEGAADLMPTILLTFDQAVDPSSVLAAARLETGDGVDRALGIVDRAELDDRMAVVLEPMDDDAWVALRPIEPLPPGSAAELTLDAGLPSLEGPLTTERAQVLGFGVRGPLELRGASCTSEVMLCEPRAWSVHFSNHLDTEQPLADRIRVRPQVEGLRIRASRSTLWLSGDFRPHSSYQVEIGGSLRDIHGQRLGRDTVVSAHFGRAQAFVQIPGAPFFALDPALNRTIEVASRSLDSVRFELYRVGPEEWSAYRRGLLPSHHERYAPWPREGLEPVAEWLVATADEGRGYSRIPVDLSAAFDEGHHAILVARPGGSGDSTSLDSRRPWRPGDAIAWIQSTSFTLGGVWNAEELVGWAVSAEDGEPVAGVRLRLPGSAAEISTDGDGLARIPLGQADSLLLGQRGDEVAILPALTARLPYESWSRDPAFPAPVWFTLTDRELYRPGEVVEAHGWIREVAGEPRRDLSFPERVDSLRYRVTGPRGGASSEGVVSLSDAGTFHVSVPLADDVRSGWHELELVPFFGDALIEEWSSDWAGFQVEEFRRPEYEVSARVDAGPHVAAAPFEARTSATYYDGAPLTAGAVAWRVSTGPAYWAPPGWTRWRFGGGSRSFGRGSGYFELEGETDGAGGHALRLVPGVPQEPVPVSVWVDVEVADANRQAGSARAHAVVLPAELTAGIRLDRQWVRTDEELDVFVAAVDLDGQVRPGVAPVVRAFLEPDEARQVATEQEVVVPIPCSRGPAREVADQPFRPFRCVLRPEIPGVYRIEAEVADDDGRRSLTRASIYAHGRARPAWRSAPERLRVTADRELYRPGDTARLLVEAPSYPAQGLVTVERNGLREIRPVTMDGPQAEIAVEIHEEDAGGLLTRVEVFSIEGTGQVHSAETFLPVDVEARRLAVSVTPDRELVSPGAEVELSVRVTDVAGAPAAGGEVTVWMVDEAILALAGYELPDPLMLLYTSPHYRDRSRSLLPHRLVRWKRRPLGPGVVSAEVLSGATGSAEDGLSVTLDGTAHEAEVSSGNLVLRGVEPGTYRLVVSRGDATLLELSVTVPAGGLDLGTLMVPTEPAALSLDQVVVGNSISALHVAPRGPTAATLEASRDRQQNPVDVREDFSALAAFEADLELDDAGEARVTVRLPDTMTRYRVLAVATQGPRRFGTGEGVVTAARDLIVRLSPPRLLHPGDRPELPVLVHNTSDRAARVELVARTAGLALTGERGFALTLPPGAHQEVRFPAEAIRAGNGDVEVLAVAGFSDGDTRATQVDAVRMPVPIVPPLAPRAAAVHERVDGGSSLALTLATPARAYPGFGGIDVGVSTTLLLPAVDALRALCLEPHSWPEATAARVLGLAGIDAALDELRSADLPNVDAIRARTALDIERLTGWVSNGTFLSSFSALNAIHALSVAGEVDGYGLDDSGLRSHQHRIRRIWESEHRWMSSLELPARGHHLATAAYAVYVASRIGGDLGPEWVEWAAALEPADLPAEVLAWLMAAASDVDELSTVRDDFLRELENRALTTGATATIRQGGRLTVEDEDLHVQRLVLASSRRSDAAVLLGLLQQEPDHPLVPRLVRGLLAHRDGSLHGRVHENAWVLLALGRYAATHEATAPDMTVRVALDGRPLSDPIRLDSTRHTETLSDALPPPGQEAVLAVEAGGAGAAYIRAGVRYAPVVGPETPAEERGFLVTRRYEAVDDSTDVRLDPDGTWRVRAGARVRVRLTISALALRYQVQLTDPVPGGFEALNPRLEGTGFTGDPSPAAAAQLPPGALSAPLRGRSRDGPFGWDLSESYFRWRAYAGRWATHEELGDERMDAYTPLMPAGTYESTYLVRATTPGRFIAPPTRIEETENRETFGQAKVDVIVVEVP